MPGMMQRIKEFTRSPQGRRVTAQVRKASADPRRRAQARRMMDRLRGRH